MAAEHYCERGGSGADGADGAPWPSVFLSESSTPPPCDSGAVGAPGCDCEPGVPSMIEAGLRSELACQDRNRLVRKKPTARIAVVRVNRLAVPRLDMKPPPPPTPSPPPSDFCSKTAPISAETIIRWITIATVCISTFHRKPGIFRHDVTGKRH